MRRPAAALIALAALALGAPASALVSVGLGGAVKKKVQALDVKVSGAVVPPGPRPGPVGEPPGPPPGGPADPRESLVFTPLAVFPEDPDLFFNPPDLDQIQGRIARYGQFGGQSFLTPFMQNFGTNHPEGTGKWYMYSQGRDLLVRAPGRAVLFKNNDFGGRVDTIPATKALGVINGEPVYLDASLILYLDKTKHMEFGHIAPLRSLVQAVIDSPQGYLIVEPGTPLGYAPAAGGIDLLAIDDAADNGLTETISLANPSLLNSRVCPLTWFGAELRALITERYESLIYAKMREGGKWPQSLLCGPVNFNSDGQVWGTWYYKAGDVGPLPAEGLFAFRWGLLVFMALPSTNPETFFNALHPDDRNPLGAAAPDLAGLLSGYYDNPTHSLAPYLALVSGGPAAGIFSARSLLSSYPITNYLKFEVVSNDVANRHDDELKLKSFASLTEAQADPMTAGFITYVKDDKKGIPNSSGLP